jgi:uncharacterized cupredoxin-like copper-binding protein
VKRLVGLGALLLITAVSGCAPASTNQATITFRYSQFAPGDLRVKAGVPVTFTLHNDDPIEHEWIVGPSAVHQVHRIGTEAFHNERPTEVTVRPYETKTTTIVFDNPGALEYICHLPGHEAYGMKGVLTIVR